MGGLILRLKNWWQAADRTQKLITVCGGGFLVVLLIGTFIYASRPKMEILFSSLAPEDSGNVAMEIEAMGLPVTFDNNGNVFVPSDKRAQIKANLAMKGKLPKANHSGVDALSKLPMFQDTKVQTAQLKEIQQSELSQAIQFFEGVDSASVQITPASDAVFENEKKAAQANITISEKPGSLISDDQARAMASLVSSSVPGLDKSKVTIFTRTGRSLWDGQDMEDSSTRANSKLDLEKQIAKQKKEELQKALDSMLGQGNAIAMVNVNLNTDEQTENIHQVRPTKPLATKSIEENAVNSGGAGTSVGTGIQGNLGSSPTIGDGGSGSSKSSYGVTQTANEMAVDTTEKVIKHAVGEVKGMSITVLVNKTKDINVDPTSATDPVVMLANSYLGTKIADTENYTAKVVTYPFDKQKETEAKAAAAAAASSSRMQQILSILPIVALLVVAFMVVKSIGKLAGRPMSPALAMAGGGPALQMGEHHATNSFGIPAKSLEAANRFVLPEIVKQKALEAGISEEQLHAAMEEAGDAGISIDDIPSIKSRINVPLEQIKKMAHEKPEVVAMLVKSWLIEEGIRR